MLATALVCSLDGPLDAPCERWVDDVSAADCSVLDRVSGPAIDVGCGPGRLVVALARRGIPVLGIDVTPSAVQHARARGASVLERSVFERVPGSGRWRSALLVDGNIGIGGDPITLLGRVRSLLRPAGNVLVELDAPGTRSESRVVRLDIEQATGPWFALCRVGADTLPDVAAAAGLVIDEEWHLHGRWFADLRKRAAP
jgi:SAM-dependent methyltransferase